MFKREAKKGITSQPVIVGGVSGGRKIPKLSMLVVGMLVVLATATYGILRYGFHRDASRNGNYGKKVSYEESVTGVAKDAKRTRPLNTDAEFVQNFGQAADSLESGDYAGALELYKKAEAAPGYKPSDFYAQMALAYKGLGDKANALTAILKAKEIYITQETKGVSVSQKDATVKGFDLLAEEYKK